MKKFLLALIAIFVLAGCGSDPKGVAEDFIRALYEGDSKTLVDAIDIPDKDRSDDGSMQMINGKLMQMAGAGKEEASKRDGLKGVSGELQNSDEKSALVKVVVSFKNGTNRTESVKLVKKDGKWGLLDDLENEILKPAFYDEVELVKVLSDDYIKIILDGRETIVYKNGKIIS